MANNLPLLPPILIVLRHGHRYTSCQIACDEMLRTARVLIPLLHEEIVYRSAIAQDDHRRGPKLQAEDRPVPSRPLAKSLEC